MTLRVAVCETGHKNTESLVSLAKTMPASAQSLLEQVKARMAAPLDPLYAQEGMPLLVSDGDLAIPPAMLKGIG